MGVVLGGARLEEFVQPLQRVVLRAASDAGQVIDFSAHAAYPAGLLDDAGLLHAAKELHPLHRQDAVVRALAEHREHMQLQGADGSHRRSVRPAAALGGVPLAGQVLEGVAGGLLLGGLAGALGGQGVATFGGIVAQLGGLLAGLLAGQLVAALAVGAQPDP
ncbi:hypothetical protein D3C85_1124500 [compost metagenome]